MTLIFATFLITAVLLISVWLIYPMILLVLCRGKRIEKVYKQEDMPLISVVIAAHNEAENLTSRTENIFAGNYPSGLVEVVVASDGSTDDTPQICKELRKTFPSIKLVEIRSQGGRSNAHNVAVPHCSGEILVFTDAETVFEEDFLTKIIAPFSDDKVGFTSGVLHYRNAGSSNVTKSAGLYWRFEYFLRRVESKLGVYVFGTGACCAVRKKLYRPIPPTGDVDFTTPLDVVLQGYRCVHVEDAVAYEVMPDTPSREFRARVRMTAKNLYGTLTRWGLGGMLNHPIYSLVIFFHKVGRWLTPFAMIGLFISNLLMLESNIGYVLLFSGQVLFYLLAVFGYFHLPVPLSSQVYSFCLANAGFFIGVLKAIVGSVPTAYKPMSKN